MEWRIVTDHFPRRELLRMTCSPELRQLRRCHCKAASAGYNIPLGLVEVHDGARRQLCMAVKQIIGKVVEDIIGYEAIETIQRNASSSGPHLDLNID